MFLRCIVIFLMLAILPAMTFSKAQAADVKKLKIGYLLCVSGWYSVFDAVEEGHLKIVAQMINDRGGLTIQGQKYEIELVGEDGKSALDGITAGATRLAYDHQVKFVVGPTGFFSTGSSPVFEPNKILHISGYNTCQPGEMDASTPYGFLAFNASIGTSISIIKAMKKEFPNVKKVAIVTPDDGAVPYLIPKIKKILANMGYTVVGDTVPYPNEMEDFSPIAAKLNAIKEADLIIGSRYISGVNVINWPMSRLLLSYYANVYSRVITGLPVRDATGGFKCFRREVLEAIDLDKVKSNGYSFQIEMSFRAWKRGFKIKEIPIVFEDRKVGQSKMSKKIVREAVWMVWRLRLWSLLGKL